MKDAAEFLLGIVIGAFLSITICAIIYEKHIAGMQKIIIDAGCGYYNSDKEFVIKNNNEVIQ